MYGTYTSDAVLEGLYGTYTSTNNDAVVGQLYMGHTLVPTMILF